MTKKLFFLTFTMASLMNLSKGLQANTACQKDSQCPSGETCYLNQCVRQVIEYQPNHPLQEINHTPHKSPEGKNM